MSKLIKPGTGELNTRSSSADAGSAVSESGPINSGAIDSIELNKITQSPVSQRDYLQLMLVQLRRVEDLEQENRKLLAERDVLNEKYQEQLKIVTSLKVEKARVRSSKKSTNSSTAKSSPQTSNIDELPAIDAAEFQPLQDMSTNNGLTQGYKVVADTTAALGNSFKSSASWCGKKVVSILT